MVTNDNIAAAIRVHTGVNVNRCYQCGKCSAGCALNGYMDYPPSVVMRMLQTGSAADYDALLRSEAIWLCVACRQCLTRCPMQIDIPALADHLREQALAGKKVNRRARKIVAFHRAFLDCIRYTGRLYEVGLVAGYKLRTLKLWQDVKLVPAMLRRGKLPLLPDVIRERGRVKALMG